MITKQPRKLKPFDSYSFDYTVQNICIIIDKLNINENSNAHMKIIRGLSIIKDKQCNDKIN